MPWSCSFYLRVSLMFFFVYIPFDLIVSDNARSVFVCVQLRLWHPKPKADQASLMKYNSSNLLHIWTHVSNISRIASSNTNSSNFLLSLHYGSAIHSSRGVVFHYHLYRIRTMLLSIRVVVRTTRHHFTSPKTSPTNNSHNSPKHSA
jgi:hypothetical protein